MIKNERQYKITKSQAIKFRKAIHELEKEPDASSAIHPILRKAQLDAMRSQLDDLEAEIQEFDYLRSGKADIQAIKSIELLPETIIKARIAAGFTYKDLANKLGVQEQQIQRYEASDYKTASLGRLIEIAKILEIEFAEEIEFPEDNISLNHIFSRLASVGFDLNFIVDRLILYPTSSDIKHYKAPKEDDQEIALQLSNILKRIFGWSYSKIIGDEDLNFDSLAVSTANFKIPSRSREPRLHAYIVYAHYLALLVNETAAKLPLLPLSPNPIEFRRTVIDTFGEFNFENSLRYIWSMGVPVLPLCDPSAFHGACWRFERRNIIVLKQRTRSQARWLFDLLHEYWHVTQQPESEEFSIIEAAPTSSERRESFDEEEASSFAGDVVLEGRAEELANLCVKEAHGKVEFLKKAVQKIAKGENVPIDCLANYMAFRLSLQDINWWGTAENLQEDGNAPFSDARDLLLQNVDLSVLNEIDRNLLFRALTNH